jgi:phthiocerol/phenolphthiocerol synthesis type-I polyketide synthase E
MSDFSKRIADLSPERRRLLEQLLKDQEPVTASASPASPGPLEYSVGPAASSTEVKAKTRRFYNSVNQQLDATMFGQHAFFLNFGYVANGSPEYSTIALAPNLLNRNCVKLVLELIGDCDLTNRRVLDVGCGRGGTVYVINRFFKPQAIIGLDLSPQAIAFCRTTHRYPHVTFLTGDAEKLEFEDETFDVVTNVESSHSYPEIKNFYMGVYRMLKPGGYFLYTDLLAVDLFNDYLGFLRRLEFEVEVERDITANVLLSCDETARIHRGAFRQDNDAHIADNFLGVPGSQVYNLMKTKESSYRIYKFRKQGEM